MCNHLSSTSARQLNSLLLSRWISLTSHIIQFQETLSSTVAELTSSEPTMDDHVSEMRKLQAAWRRTGPPSGTYGASFWDTAGAVLSAEYQWTQQWSAALLSIREISSLLKRLKSTDNGK